MDHKLRDLVRNRAGHHCEYCQLPQRFFQQLFQIEHIVARSHGGADGSENLALACPRCNLHKGPNLSGIDPDTNTLNRLFNPRTDDWTEHFSSSHDGTLLGLSEIGRTTVRVLAMNAERRVKLRRAIAAMKGPNQ